MKNININLNNINEVKNLIDSASRMHRVISMKGFNGARYILREYRKYRALKPYRSNYMAE